MIIFTNIRRILYAKMLVQVTKTSALDKSLKKIVVGMYRTPHLIVGMISLATQNQPS